MRFRTWPVLAFALCGLLGLIAASVLATRTRAKEIFARLDEMSGEHRRIETTLRRLRSDVHLSGIFVRDYLLDPTASAGPEYRQQLSELRASTAPSLAELQRLLGAHEDARLERLRALFSAGVQSKRGSKASQ